ncbi:hypothetical protein D3C87_2016150 [compost metagenome]
MPATEIQHLLGLRDAADKGARDGPAAVDEGSGIQLLLQRSHVTHEHQSSTEGQRWQIGAEFVNVRHGVDDQVEAALPGRHLRRVG